MEMRRGIVVEGGCAGIYAAGVLRCALRAEDTGSHLNGVSAGNFRRCQLSIWPGAFQIRYNLKYCQDRGDEHSFPC